MKNNTFYRTFFIMALFLILLSSCHDEEPTSDIFSWSPTGNKLSMYSIGTDELLMIDIKDNNIGNISQIDTFKEEESKVFSHSWSIEGELLLYTKCDKENYYVYIYSVLNKKKNKILTLPNIYDKHFDKFFPPVWAPKGNKILYTSWVDSEHVKLSVISPESKIKNTLILYNCFDLKPVWSSDSESIYYSVYINDGHKNNGVWKIKSDGSQNKQIHKANKISLLSLNPEGDLIAIVEDNGNMKEKLNKLSVIDLSKNECKNINELKGHIAKVDWGQDGKNIVYLAVDLQDADSKNNIIHYNIENNQNTNLTFDNCQDYFGCFENNKLFYTIDFPEDIVELSEQEKENVEFFDGIKSIEKKNILLTLDNSKITKLGQNIFGHNYCVDNKIAAYYISVSQGILESRIFLPVIEFPSGERVFLPRRKEEYSAAADELFLNREYAKSIEFVNKQWNLDFRSTNLKDELYFDSDSSKIAVLNKGNHKKRLINNKDASGLIKIILLLRKSGYTDNASYIFDQYKRFFASLLVQQSDNNMDDMYWSYVNSYGRYNELSSGIKDLDEILLIAENDSTHVAYVRALQAILAISDYKYEDSLEKLESCLERIPKSMDDLEIINQLLYIQLYNSQPELNSRLEYVYKECIRHAHKKQDLNVFYAGLAKLYKKINNFDEMSIAYRKAVVSQFDKHEIWQEILFFRE